MRIELNSGGLAGVASIADMQSDVSSLLGKADTFLSALRNIKNFTYNINGGVGILRDALAGIESRIQTAETQKNNLNEAKAKINSFIELTRKVDSNVGSMVDKNKEEFYNMNPWSKPSPNAAVKMSDEDLADLAFGVGNGIADTASKALDNILSFSNPVKKGFDKIFAHFMEWWGKSTKIVPIEIKDEVFDPDKSAVGSGNYGGYQGRPRNNVVVDGDLSDIETKYLDILEANTGREFSEQELKDYLNELANHGCGYTAMVNTIMEYYCNRPDGEEEFYRKFNVPMKKEDGELNYDIILVDLYSKTNKLEHNGSSGSSRRTILSEYMGDSGADGKSSVTVKVENDVDVNTNNFEQYVREGKQVIVYGNNIIIYSDEDKNVQQNCGGAGHAMVVTGVTDSGLLIVSTWSGKCYLDPKDNGMLNEYRYTPSRGKTVDMKFQTVEFVQ